MSSILIGTSGWTYDDWRGPFYPRELAKKRWLQWYAGQFPTDQRLVLSNPLARRGARVAQ